MWKIAAFALLAVAQGCAWTDGDWSKCCKVGDPCYHLELGDPCCGKCVNSVCQAVEGSATNEMQFVPTIPPEPAFPNSFSATRVIMEPHSSRWPVQYGWEKRDYAKGLHATARSIDNKTTDETVVDSSKQAGWTVWRDYNTKEETRCASFNYHSPPPQKYLQNATYVKNFACPGPGGSAVAVGCDFWTGLYKAPAGDQQVTVAVLGGDHTQLVHMEWEGGGLKMYFPIHEWKSGSADINLPSDCPKPAVVV